MIYNGIGLLDKRGRRGQGNAFKTHEEKNEYKPRTAHIAKVSTKFKGGNSGIFLTWDSLKIKMPPCNLWHEAIKIVFQQN